MRGVNLTTQLSKS